MSDEIRVNRQQGSQMNSAPVSLNDNQNNNSGNSKLPWIVLAVIVVLLAVSGVLFRDKLTGSKTSADKEKTVTGKASGYQAVFLTNGQVYFGKLSKAESPFPVMTEIYYLQVVQPPLQGQQDPNQPTQQTANQPQISLVKLGNELHGPTDEMKINREHILFYEDLREDGQVVVAIKNNKATPEGAGSSGNK